MADDLFIPKTANRETIYESLLTQLQALVDGEINFTANTANVMAALKEAFGFLWVGCYFISTASPPIDLPHKVHSVTETGDGEELVLGPFQGPVACTRIKKGKGVCGTSWEKNETIIVPDVELFPGHIACSSFSRSEIVVPLRRRDGSVFGVLDLDSIHVNDFSEKDKKYLERVALLISNCFGA